MRILREFKIPDFKFPKFKMKEASEIDEVNVDYEKISSIGNGCMHGTGICFL